MTEFFHDVNFGTTTLPDVSEFGDFHILEITAGGTANFPIVHNYGVLDLHARDFPGGDNDPARHANSFYTIVGSSGTETVRFNGVDSFGTVAAHGEQFVYSGGVAQNTIIAGTRAVQAIGFFYGLVDNTVEGGVAGGLALSATVLQAGTQAVGSGGLALDTKVEFGGQQIVGGSFDFEGQTSFSTDFTGGIASNTLVQGGGLETVDNGGVTIGTTLSGLNLHSLAANEFVFEFGTGIDTTVDANGILAVEAGTASGTTVNSGGYELVFYGGAAFDTTVNKGGFDLVFDDGITIDETVSGGAQVLEGPATGLGVGSSFDTTVTEGGTQAVFGFANGTDVENGTMVVWTGGFSEFATVDQGGFDFVLGTTSLTTLSGGTEFVLLGGVAIDTIAFSGSTQVVADSGTAIGGDIGFGAASLVESGGTVEGLQFLGGTQIVEFGGTAIGEVVEAGGKQIVQFGGTVEDTFIAGGLLEIQSGGSTDSAPVSFSLPSAGGILQLDSSQTFTGTIAGFSSPGGVTEELVLQDITFSTKTKITFTEAASNTSGTLTVTNGSQTANLTLLGVYSTAQFSQSQSATGGTIISDPPVTSSTLAAHG